MGDGPLRRVMLVLVPIGLAGCTASSPNAGARSAPPPPVPPPVLLADKVADAPHAAADPAPGRRAIRARDVQGATPLHHAALRDDADAVSRLIGAGADPEARDRHGFTPLVWAARAGKREAARRLLDEGADVHARGYYGTTVLMEAAQTNDRPEVFQLLVDRGAVTGAAE